MKRFISGVLSLAIVAGTLVSAVSVGAAGVYSDEFNSVTEKSGLYYNWYFGSAADWSATNFTQGEFAGEKVLKGNVGAAKDVKTLNSGIRAEYNNVLMPSGIKAVYKDNYGNEAEGTVSVSNGNILSVTALSELKAGRIYTLTVSGIKDVSGLESENIVRDVKMSAVKGYVQDFEQFSGQTFKVGDADKTIDGVMFRTSEDSTDIEMATVDAEHGTSAKINAVEDLAGGASQATYSDVHKKVVGFSVYMPAPDSKAAFYFRVMDTDGKLSGILDLSVLQKG